MYRTLALALCLGIVAVNSLMIESERCGKFYCPDNCNVTYVAGCPRNCKCAGYANCPRVSCPAPEPICSIHTLLDGCQTCACKLPYAVLEEEQSLEESNSNNGTVEEDNQRFVFLDSDNFDNQINERTRRGEQKLVKKFACTIPNMNKVDECSKDAMKYYETMRTTTERSPTPLNPMLAPDLEDVESMCGYMAHALKCMGPKIFQECRRSHPMLAQMDALYGYPCSGKQKVYMHHMKCIQNDHDSNYRLLACEDALARSMTYIARIDAPNDVKRQRKCDAMNWMMKCERPAITRYCSEEAAQVYTEAMEHATEYMAPECTMDHKLAVFSEKQEANDGSVSLAAKEFLACSAQMQVEIEEQMGKLYKEVVRMRSRASLAYPIGYFFREDRLKSVCKEYTKALKGIKAKTKINCYKHNAMYDTIHYTLSFPCGYASRGFFLTHFECLTSVRRTQAVRECEFLAHQRFEDPSNDVCETYDILYDCMYDPIVHNCGYEAVEAEYQYLNLVAQKHVPDCYFERIFRFIEQKPKTTTPRPTSRRRPATRQRTRQRATPKPRRSQRVTSGRSNNRAQRNRPSNGRSSVTKRPNPFHRNN